MTLPAVLTRQARADLRSAVRWIDDPAAARKLQAAVEIAAARLGEQPMMGREQSDLVRKPYRILSLSKFPYVLIYNPTTAPVRIVRILHTSRDLTSALQPLN